MMKKLCIIPIIILTVAMVEGVTPEYELLLDKIEKSVAEGAWVEADSLTSQAIASEPDNPLNPLLLSNLGMIRFYNGNDSLALATLDEAHKIAPKSVTILANRARVLTAAGRIKEAIGDYDTIEKLDSTYADTYLYRGLIRLYGTDFEGAEKDLRKREELKPENEETWTGMASLYSVTGNFEKALPYYTKLIKANPSAEYYGGRAMCHLVADRLMDASDDIASGMLLDNNYGELYLCRAILNKKYYRKEDSARDAATAIQLGVNPQRVNALLGF